MKLQTLVDHIENPTSDNPAIVAHLTTLQGPRTRGSTSERSLVELMERIGNVELSPATESQQTLIGECSGWFLDLDDETADWFGGRLNCLTLEDYDENTEIVARKGAHGWELVLANPSKTDTPTSRVFFIWSNADDCLATWHPGNPLRFLPQDCAVKLH